MLLRIVVGHVAFNHDSLSCTLFSYQQNLFALLGYVVYEKGCSHIIHVGHQNRSKFWNTVLRVNEFFHTRIPMLPVSSIVNIIFKYCFILLFLGPFWLQMYSLFRIIEHIELDLAPSCTIWVLRRCQIEVGLVTHEKFLSAFAYSFLKDA